MSQPGSSRSRTWTKGGDLFFLAWPAGFSSFCDSFFSFFFFLTQNKGGGGGRVPWAPPLDPSLSRYPGNMWEVRKTLYSLQICISTFFKEKRRRFYNNFVEVTHPKLSTALKQKICRPFWDNRGFHDAFL